MSTVEIIQFVLKKKLQAPLQQQQQQQMKKDQSPERVHPNATK
jgi:hypothetical protein